MHLEIITKQPKKDSSAIPLLLVHGAWHGAWCWEHFQSFFAEQGYTSHALSLRGHGQSEGRGNLRWFSAAEFVNDLRRVVRRLPQSLVLIGHSAGGYLIQKYLESDSAIAAILLSSVPVNGAFRMFTRLAIRHPLQYIKMHLTMNSFVLIETSELAREAFFSDDIPHEKLCQYFALLQPESYRFGWDTSFFNLPRPKRNFKVPMLVLGGGDDRLICREEVEETAKAYGTQAELFPGVAHDMMLDKDWMRVAKRIVEWLRQNNI